MPTPVSCKAPASFPTVEVTVPVFNEERRIQFSIRILCDFLGNHLPVGAWRIVIVENGSTDRTRELAEELARQSPHVQVLSTPHPNRGAALRHAWACSQAEIVAYMDADLATDLDAFPRLIERIREGSDLAIGSRLVPGARVVRSVHRELLSRVYNRLVRWLLCPPVTDAQCGFKAVRRSAIVILLPKVKSAGWFFDTELLVQAYRQGLKIREVPVQWVENRDSRVQIPSTIFRMAWEILRLRCRLSMNGRGH